MKSSFANDDFSRIRQVKCFIVYVISKLSVAHDLNFFLCSCLFWFLPHQVLRAKDRHGRGLTVTSRSGHFNASPSSNFPLLLASIHSFAA